MSFWKIWNSKDKGGRARAHERLTNFIQSSYWSWLFLRWTKWGLFELLWSLDTVGTICTHVSLLCSYYSLSHSLLAGTLLPLYKPASWWSKKKKVLFFAHLWLGETTRSYCDKLCRSTDKNIIKQNSRIPAKLLSSTSYLTTNCYNITNSLLVTHTHTHSPLFSISHPPLQEVHTQLVQSWIGFTGQPWRSSSLQIRGGLLVKSEVLRAGVVGFSSSLSMGAWLAGWLAGQPQAAQLDWLSFIQFSQRMGQWRKCHRLFTLRSNAFSK